MRIKIQTSRNSDDKQESSNSELLDDAISFSYINLRYLCFQVKEDIKLENLKK